MKEKENIKHPDTDETRKENDPEKVGPKPKDSKAVWAWIAGILTLMAWIALMIEGYTSLIIGAASIVCGFIGLKSRKKALKNLSTAAIVASAVLLVLVSAFLIVIYIGLRSM